MIAAVTAGGAVIAGGFVVPLTLAALGIALPAMAARVHRQLAQLTLLLSLPIGISALVINVFFYPGGQQLLLQLGPFAATAEGLRFALEILLRILVISSAVALFYLTTRTSELVLDLERRGVSSRVAFVTQATASAVPAMAARTANVVAAQRARGLDTEGGVLNRLRGIIPVVGPVILGSISEVEERSMALEARAFTRPGRRALLWHPTDSASQRAVRWLLLLSLVVLLLVRVSGWPAP